MDHTTVQQDDAITEFTNVRFENNDIIFSLVRLLFSRASFINSTITNNKNSELYSTFIQVSDVNISKSLFMSNIGRYEGILSISRFATATIKDTRFEDNHVDVIGGAIRSYAAELMIDNCIFYNNSASLKGGHIAQYEGTLYITNSSFEYGYTQGNGGAIARCVDDATTAMITDISNTRFAYNDADLHGGAILHGTTSQNKMTYFNLNNVQFEQNSAALSGAAIYIKNMHDIKLYFTDVEYIDNIADEIDGDIMTWPTHLSISSNVTSFCPKCDAPLAITSYDIFGNIWPSHHFYEYVFMKDIGYNVSITSIKEIAQLFNHSIHLKQRMNSNHAYAPHNTILDIVEQSKYFTQGNGNETFKFYPAIYRDELILTVSGFLSDGKTVFDEQNISFTVDKCDQHMGAFPPDSTFFSCNICGEGAYKFVRTYRDRCLPCKPGSRCAGGGNIFVENDHYAYAPEGAELIVRQCLPGSCCLDKECDIWNKTNVCPENRDPNSALCASCKDGFSVALQTNKCIKCSDNMWYFLFPILFYGGMIKFWGHKDVSSASLSFWEVYVFKVLGFFYQVTPSINILLPDTSETSDKFSWIEGVFNFHFPLHGFCVFEDMTNLDEILLQWAIPIACVIWLLMFWLLEKSGCCTLKKYCPIGPLRKIGELVMQFHFTKACIKFFIYVYAAITRISFQLLTCRELEPGDKRMYYAADIDCYQGWHILPGIGVLITVLCPIGLGIGLWVIRQSRQKDSAIWTLFTLGYKRRAWWYEPYRMTCRLLVIGFAAIPVDEEFRLVLIRYLVFAFLIIHTWVLPFHDKYKHDQGFDINKFEVICLMILCVLTMLADYEHERTRQAYQIIKYIPALMVIVLVIWKFILHKTPQLHAYIPPQELMPDTTDGIFFSPMAVQESQNKTRYSYNANDDDDIISNIDVANKPKKAISIGAAGWDNNMSDGDLDSDDEWENENVKQNQSLLMPPKNPYDPKNYGQKNKKKKENEKEHKSQSESNDSDVGIGVEMQQELRNRDNKNKVQKSATVYSSISIKDQYSDDDAPQVIKNKSTKM